MLDQVKNIVAVASGKGGVGKSTTAVNTALALKLLGKSVGLLDADIYGPSQPILLNSKPGELKLTQNKIIEPLYKEGIKFISMGLISNEKMPVIWRGPMVSGAVMQLLSQTDWGELDYLIVDTPPGTGDVQLTLLQKIPLTSALVVTTPQKVAISDCKKGIEMIRKLDLPISGLIENMSWFQPIDSEKKYFLFGQDGGKDLADEYIGSSRKTTINIAKTTKRTFRDMLFTVIFDSPRTLSASLPDISLFLKSINKR